MERKRKCRTKQNKGVKDWWVIRKCLRTGQQKRGKDKGENAIFPL